MPRSARSWIGAPETDQHAEVVSALRLIWLVFASALGELLAMMRCETLAMPRIDEPGFIAFGQIGSSPWQTFTARASRSEPHPGPLGIEKLDPGGLEGGVDLGEGLRPRTRSSPLEIGDGLFGDFRVRDEVLLRPVEQRAGGAALRWGEGH
jgi:hypothetical protein